ncbi:hypothetical protein H2201_000051 [Coniosporium apollinis]|uniref:Uncharacterized protein n=1 Tax=Coniosporium apollinis TaxID=61459 RepID=A0ABQ9PBE7_9PEZI|nr:hypothetical protein H2201_000051 [Coniosporium apollinis]
MQPPEPDHLAAKPTCYFDSWESAVDPSDYGRPSSERRLPLYPCDPPYADTNDSISPTDPPRETDPPSPDPSTTPRPPQDTSWHEWCWAPQWQNTGGDPRPRPMQVSHRRPPNGVISSTQTNSLPTTPTAPSTKRRQSSGAKALRVLGVPELTAGTMGPLTPDTPPAPSASVPSTPAPQRRKSSRAKALRVLGGPAWLPESIRSLTPENLSRSSTASSRQKHARGSPPGKQQADGGISMITSKGSQGSTNSTSTGKKSVASSKSSIARIFSRAVPDMRLIDLIDKGMSPLQRGPPQKSLVQQPTKEPSKQADIKPQPVAVDESTERQDKSAEMPAVRPQLSSMRSERSIMRNRSRERKRAPAVSWSRHSEHHGASSDGRSTPVLSGSRSSPGLVHSPNPAINTADHPRYSSSTHSHPPTPVTILDLRDRPEQSDSPSMLPTLAYKRSRPSYLRSLSSMDKLFRSHSSQKSESGASVLSSPGPTPSSQPITPLETPTSTASSPVLTHTKPHHKQRKSFLRWRWLGFGPAASSPVDLGAQTPASTATPHSQPSAAAGVGAAKAAEYFDPTDPTVIRTLSKGKDRNGKPRASKRDKVRRIASDDDFPRKAMRKATTRYHPQREADVYSLSSNKSRHSPPTETTSTGPAPTVAAAPLAPPHPAAPVTGAKLTLPRERQRQPDSNARTPAFLSEAQRVNTPPLPTTRPGTQGLTGFFISYAAPGEDPLTTPPRLPASLALRPPLSAPAAPTPTSTSTGGGGEVDYYRVRMERILNAGDDDESEDGEVEARAGFDWSIPEHLPNSPLCPLSPKFRGGGREICVYHGRGRG